MSLVSEGELMGGRRTRADLCIVVAVDKLDNQQQIRLAARTTILMGVHGSFRFLPSPSSRLDLPNSLLPLFLTGNGLTHLLFMKPTTRSTVMEFFYPGGFACAPRPLSSLSLRRSTRPDFPSSSFRRQTTTSSPPEDSEWLITDSMELSESKRLSLFFVSTRD